MMKMMLIRMMLMKMMLNDKEEDQDLAAGNPCHLLPPIQKGWECGDDDISISHMWVAGPRPRSSTMR